ncbi:hypothetical protein [Glycomyces paridis]|uniref:Tetratricopeptide repeat protein n=1 Tax=Glycomyces paridis TaxID=2126555 RepID=A0A4S8NVS0_9ACTN|nr:hypothetical protein [Glycomyces paridis]THV21717.1 hypothetical protein E9998_24455 [Glycomyces paridis]
MSDVPDHLIGLRGAETTGPRWAAFRELNNRAAMLSNDGRNAEATALLLQAYELTTVPDVDAAGLDGRARALANLAALAEGRGEPGEALRYTEEALLACERAQSEAGNRYGTAAVHASLLINRAQTLQLVGRLDDALADLDTAMTLTADTETVGDDVLVAVMLHNTRSVLLIGLERWEEAEAAARHTLQLATAHDPRLTGHPYTNLAVIAQALNDHGAALEYLRLAEQVHAAAGDPAAAALAVANQGRAAMRMGDFASGQRLLAEAEQAFADGEEPLRAAEIRFGRAHGALQSGDVETARALLGPALAVLRESGHTTMLAEALAVAGDLAAAGAEYEEAEASYLAAREVYAASGARYHLARIDMRRSFAVSARCAIAVTASESQRLLRAAFDLSLPSALATDAIRHQFAPGRAREQWAATVAIPAMAHALHLAAAMQDGALVSELLEHMSATVSLHAPAAPETVPLAEALGPDPLALDVPEDFGRLSYTASALITGLSESFPATRFALPPRLRVNPWRESQLEPWIQETERRYGFPIRSDEVIDTW